MLHYFSEGIPFFEKYFRGWVDEKHIIFGTLILYILLRDSLVPPAKHTFQHVSIAAYFSHFMARGFTIVAKWMHAKNSLTLTDPDGVP